MAGIRRPLLSPCAGPCAREDGFTIIEVMVAAAVLLVGLMGVLGIVTKGESVSASNRAREQGIALQREIVEAARSIPYDQLSQATIVGKIRATTGLTDSTMTATGWTYLRRNIKYTVAIGTCAVDDPTDGTGPHESAGYCLDGTGATTPSQCAQVLGISGDIAGNGTASGNAIGDCGIDANRDGNVDNLADTSGSPCSNCSGSDTNPNDYKRIVVLVRWNKGFGSRYALQSTTLPNPGLAAAPAITSLTPASVLAKQGDQVLNFSVTLNTTPAAVPWYVDGTAHSPQATGSGQNWSFFWDLGQVNYTTGGRPNSNEILDGTYVVSAKGVDAYGQAGSAKASTVIVNRRAPYAPTNPHAGRNGSSGNVGYVDWGANAEGDVLGYNVYRVGSPDQLVCSMVKITRCKDTGLPATASQYYVRAVDRDTSGNTEEGDVSATMSVPATSSNTPPSAPGPVSAAKPGNTILSWGQATPVAGDPILFYRIYRDGTDWVDNYYARTASAANLSFTDNQTGGDVHTYWVVAVDQSYVESRPLGGGVTK
jgi:prepilin-type N-terminal cleavage/methylation domain-containing protein